VALVAMLVEREPWAERLAWQRFAPTVRRMCGRVFDRGADVDDLVQDIFLAFFRQVHALRDPRSMRAYVVSITRFAIRHALRRKATARLRYVSDPPRVVAAPPDVEAHQALDRLHQILDRLNPDDRTAFVLRFVEGKDPLEISQALSVSVTTAKRRISRAWKRVAFHARREASLVAYVAHARESFAEAASESHS
jgi:RNA polymerase sigma-70 factor (ECF subfamily)